MAPVAPPWANIWLNRESPTNAIQSEFWPNLDIHPPLSNNEFLGANIFDEKIYERTRSETASRIGSARSQE